MSNQLVLRPSYWASVSGGKDSLLMMKLIFDNPDKYPLDGVVHFELEIDYPFIKNVVNYIKGMCEQRGVKFVSLKPRRTWEEIYKLRGFPDRNLRWCNREYKLDASSQLKEYMKSIGYYVVYYIGYCADEVERYEKRSNKKEVYPLVDFGIDEDRCLEWAKMQPIFNHYYETQRRCGCMFCPIASYINMAYTLKHYPNEYKKLIEMIKETEEKVSKKLGRPYAIKQSNPKYNGEYVDNIVRTKYLPKLEEMERSINND